VAAHEHPDARSRLGVDLAGFFAGAAGLGAVARNVEAALGLAGVAVTPIPLPSPGAAPAPAPRSGGHPAALLCVTPGTMAAARDALGATLDGKRVIGLWWWEVSAFPARWARAFDGLDEVWVGSRFMADLLAAVSPVPVIAVPTPVPEPEPEPLTRAELGLPAGFLFGFVFDYASVAERKNPLGAIEAFRRAFAPEERDVALVLKTLGGEEHPGEHARVLAAAAADDRIRVIDADLPAGRKDALIAALDCFVSLHRSEGFGLAIAEAMLLGKPVVATDQGGPRDLLSAFNAYPVDHVPVAVGPGHDPYPADAEWAEPDLDHAAAQLRRVRDDPVEARARGARARADTLRSHAPVAAGAAMAARLQRGLGLPSAAPEAAVDVTDLARRLRRGMEHDGRELTGPRRALRTLVLRLLRPYTAHQRLVDEELLRALRTLDERVRGAVAGQQALAAELRARDRADREDPLSPSSRLDR
jgi:glycosyltransferase involved in cell wall biosynthesis